MEALVVETSDDGCLVQSYVFHFTILYIYKKININLKLSPSGTKLMLSPQQIVSSLMPAQGDVVTIEYEHFSKTDVPVDPLLSRIRYDLEWRDVLNDFVNENILSGM